MFASNVLNYLVGVMRYTLFLRSRYAFACDDGSRPRACGQPNELIARSQPFAAYFPVRGETQVSNAARTRLTVHAASPC